MLEVNEIQKLIHPLNSQNSYIILYIKQDLSKETTTVT
jgi:hypothetical protein